MKAFCFVLVIVALSAPSLTSAQDKSSNDLNTLLRDASYVFNRFEEVSSGVEAQMDTNYPVPIKKASKDALSAVLANVAAEKVALNALLGQSKVPSGDLLDVYIELAEVASELAGLSYEISEWGDRKIGTDLAQMAAKANVLSAHLGVTLRAQIAAQELQLAACTQKIRANR